MKSRWHLILLSILAVIIIGLFLPVYSDVNLLTPTTLARHRIGHLGLELMRYADEHDGNFPGQLSDLQTNQLPDSDEIRQFRDSVSKVPRPWLYFAGHKVSDPPQTILAAAPLPTDDEKRGIWSVAQRRVIWTVAGRTDAILESEFQQRSRPSGNQ